MQIKKARREKQKAIIGFIGPSGSGKTVSALLTAYGMVAEKFPDASDAERWEKVGVIDTEHSRSQLYVNEAFGSSTIGEFLHLDLAPPYSTDRYQQAIEMMVNEGVEVVVIDSLSHNWQGEGGIVDTHANMTGNSFQNWGKLAGETNNLVKTLTRNNIHILCTLRTKTEYVLELNDKGKQSPKKIGTKPMQKDEMEYEFMINFNVGIDHIVETTKDNTRLFEGTQFIVDESVGRKLFRWLELGQDVMAEEKKLREAEDLERKALIEKILVKSSTDEATQKVITDCEFKTNKRLAEFDMKLVQRVIQLIGGIENV